MADKLSKALDKDIIYNEVSAEVYRGFGFPGADDIGNMFQFYRDFEKDGLEVRNIEESKNLNPALQNFDMWLAKNITRIPIEE